MTTQTTARSSTSTRATTSNATSTRRQSTNHTASSRPAASTPTDKVRPVHQIRLGIVKAAIWANPTHRNTVMYTVTLQRIYKTGGLWKRSETFRRDDLLTVAKALDLAHSWIHREQANAASRSATSTAA